jgi:hypothetical protein
MTSCLRAARRSGPSKGDEEEDAAPLEDLDHRLQALADPGAMTARLVSQDLADDVQDVAAALLGRDVFLHVFAEGEEPDFVVVVEGGEGQDRG